LSRLNHLTIDKMMASSIEKVKSTPQPPPGKSSYAPSTILRLIQCKQLQMIDWAWLWYFKLQRAKSPPDQ